MGAPSSSRLDSNGTNNEATDFLATTRIILDEPCSNDRPGCDPYPEQMRLSYLYGTLPLILFCAISVAINIKILVSAAWIRRPLSPTLHISLSLAGADAFSSTALGIGLVMNSFIPHGLGLELRGVGCFLLSLEAIRLGGVMITVGHLVALAVNHYLGIVKPLHYLTIMTRRITSFLVIFLWILPLLFFFAYFSAVENEGFQSRHCEINRFLFRRKFRVMFSSLFFGPFIIMVCIYAHIFCIVKKHQAARMRFCQAGSSFRRCDDGQGEREDRSASQQMARNVKAVNTTLFILGSFVVGWLPATFLYVLVCEDCPFEFDWLTGRVKFLVYNTSNCLVILKTLANPIIYAARMHEIQVATKKMQSAMCGSRDAIDSSRMQKRTHSRDNGLFSRKLSLSRRTMRRITVNDRSGNNKTFEYTYKGLERYSRNNTFV